MRNDLSVLIARAEKKGASFRLRDGQVEVLGLGELPEELTAELRTVKEEVASYLSGLEKERRTVQSLGLLAWAAELAEEDVVLTQPVSYIEAPLRTVTTQRASWYAATYLRDITFARLNQSTGGWGRFTPVWRMETEQEALAALVALRDAMSGLGRGEENGSD